MPRTRDSQDAENSRLEEFGLHFESGDIRQGCETQKRGKGIHDLLINMLSGHCLVDITG